MFSRPVILWLLLLFPVLGLAWTFARWRRRRLLAQLANPFRIERLVSLRRGRRWLMQSLVGMGLAAVVLGLAGPHWGEEKARTRPPHQDLMIVLDVSRSMTAEQPSRLERSLRSLEHLNDVVRRRGEVRLGLVLSAAHPVLQLPPSRDYDHLELLLDRARRGDLPPQLWRKDLSVAVSGTRLGAALALAAARRQSDSARSFDIVLVSDGHDPLEDQEWLFGVQAARAAGIPVHVVAVGDPERPHPLPETLREGKGPRTQLNEKVLREIASRTEGAYIPAHTQTHLPLGSLMREVLAARRIEEAAADSTLTEPAPRQVWFFLAAAVLFGSALLCREGMARTQLVAQAGRDPTGRLRLLAGVGNAAARMAAASLALCLVSAAPPPGVEEVLRQGNAAFARGDFEGALRAYDQAQGRTLDPGLLAFNKGAALFRLGRAQEAALFFQQAVEDQAAPVERKQRSYYDLGTALLAGGDGNPATLRQAVDAFRSCLDLTPATLALHDDARHNLELSQRLWLAAIARKKTDDKEAGGSDLEPKTGKSDDKSKGDAAKTGKSDKSGDKSPGKFDGVASDKVEGKDKAPAPGARLNIEDRSAFRKLSPEELQELLREQIERIAQERLSDRHAAPRTLGDAPNW